MELHYYCLNCDVFFDEDQVGTENGATYCIWCDSEDLMLTGSEPVPSYVIDSNPYAEVLVTSIVDHKRCRCEDYPCCGH